MAATTPTPDARRVRRWLARALAVSGGAAAATAIAWGVGTTSASAVENPLDNVGDAKPAADVPFASGSGDTRSPDSHSPGSHSAETRAAGEQSGARHAQSSDGGSDHGDASGRGESTGAGAGSPDTASGRHVTDRANAEGLAACDHAPGPSDVRGLFDDAHTDRFDIARFADRGRELSGRELSGAELPGDAAESVAAAESVDSAHGTDSESAPCPDSGADRPDGADAPDAAEQTEQSGAADGSDAARQHVEQTWSHVTGRTRDAVHGFGDALRTVADDWSGDRSPDWNGWPDVELPWSGFAPDPGDLPSPNDVPWGSGGPDLPEGAAQTSPHDADARAPGDERHDAVTSTSDRGNHETSGVLDTGHDGASTESAAVDTDSGEPTTPSFPEFDPQYVPASVPSHSSIAGSAHADAPSGAVITTAAPFAVAAAGAVRRSGLLHKSMSPGSQPGVTPD
ncbi:hypothetical protein [Prauserella alba]|uniref:Uncharacterized protein n=1 Tax=Prauserella alba TaxID=176898 RepID=A0ABN1V9G3_9PSEU|nr:hypothetical protein [Prauserella alba]MCP2183079.1 hypothetical protein [Prauserella alba]